MKRFFANGWREWLLWVREHPVKSHLFSAGAAVIVTFSACNADHPPVFASVLFLAGYASGLALETRRDCQQSVNSASAP